MTALNEKADSVSASSGAWAWVRAARSSTSSAIRCTARYHEGKALVLLVRVRVQRELRAATISHDEVVHGKGSLFGQDDRPPLAEARTTCAPLLAIHVGAYGQEALLFMGQELGQALGVGGEPGALDWWLLDQPSHSAGILDFVRAMNERVPRENSGPMGEGMPTARRSRASDQARLENPNVPAFARRDHHGNTVRRECAATPRACRWEG